jgi:biofilm PGA synthesis protein PgaD
LASSSENIRINAPELLSRRRRLGDTLITGLMWVLYTYLWAPLVSLIAWLLGFEFAYDVMVRAGGVKMLKQALVWYGLTLACIIVVVTGWSIMNRLRFAQRNRRQAGKVVGDSEMAATFEIDTKTLADLRGARIARVSLDENGAIERIETNPRPQRD